jgi:exodeoxyribonuclease VII large subunit
VPALADLEAALRARRGKLIAALTHRTSSARGDIRTSARNMRSAAIRIVDKRRSVMSGAAGRLNALSPLATLSRGYAVARRPDGEALTSATQFVPGESFDLTLRDGAVNAVVEHVEHVEPDGATPDE